MFPRLWPVTCRYAATAISVNRWEKTFETAFNGANYYALGHLVFIARSFRTNPRLLLMHPALMAGWKIEFGMRYKGVLMPIDYQALREGKIVTAEAPDREVYSRDRVVVL